MSQSYPRLEVLIVDDVSSDESLEIASDYASRCNYFRIIRRSKQGGPATAFNTGFDAAKGTYMLRLAQDDLLLPDTVERMVCQLTREPGKGLIYASMFEFESGCDNLAVRELGPPDDVILNGKGIGLCVMWRSEVWRAVGGFDPKFDMAEDFEFFLRCAKYTQITKLEGSPALRRRIHDGMASKHYRPQQDYAFALSQFYRPSNSFPRRYWIAVGRYYQAYSLHEHRSMVQCAWTLILAFAHWPEGIYYKLFRSQKSSLWPRGELHQFAKEFFENQ